LKNKKEFIEQRELTQITGSTIDCYAVTDAKIGSIDASQITSGTLKFSDFYSGLNFGTALHFLKEGKKVKRKEWGGYWKLEHWHKAEFEKPELIIVAYLEDTGRYKPATTHQEHILAEDWEVVE
jgi:hypothetical protein